MKAMTSGLAVGLVYSALFWSIEGLRCATAVGGCQREGDISIVVLVLICFAVTIGAAFGVFLLAVQRALDRWAHLWGKGKSSVFLLAAFTTFGIAVPATFFALTGQLYDSFLRVGGFWVNAVVGSVGIIGYMKAFHVPSTAWEKIAGCQGGT